MGGTERAALQRLGRRRRKHAEEALLLRAETSAAVMAALAAGMSGPEVARALGVSHQRVYRIVEEDQRDGR